MPWQKPWIPSFSAILEKRWLGVSELLSVSFPWCFITRFSQIFIFFQILTSHLSRQPSTSSTGSCRHDEVPTCHHPLTDARNIRHVCTSNKSMTVCHLLVLQPELIPFKTSAIRLSACIVLAALKESKSFIWHSFKQLKHPNHMSDNSNVWHPKWLVWIRLFQKSWNFGSSGGPSTRRGSLLRFLQAESHRTST